MLPRNWIELEHSATLPFDFHHLFAKTHVVQEKLTEKCATQLKFPPRAMAVCRACLVVRLVHALPQEHRRN